MSQRDVTRHLMSKDFFIIRSLITAVLGLHLVVHLLLLYFWSTGDLRSDGLAELSIFAWVVIPNLFSFGAPVLLVGSEEEAGTNDWLRTLPIRWQSIWASRLWVALGSAALIWAVATVIFYLLSFAWTDAVRPGNQLDSQGIWLTAFFSLLLPLLSFLCAYAFRSPMVAKGVFIVAYSIAGYFLMGAWFAFALILRASEKNSSKNVSKPCPNDDESKMPSAELAYL